MKTENVLTLPGMFLVNWEPSQTLRFVVAGDTGDGDIVLELVNELLNPSPNHSKKRSSPDGSGKIG